MSVPDLDDLITDYLSVFPYGNTDKLQYYIKYYDNHTINNIIRSFLEDSMFNYYQSIDYYKMYDFIFIIVSQVKPQIYEPPIIKSNLSSNAEEYVPSNNKTQDSNKIIDYSTIVSNIYTSLTYQTSINNSSVLTNSSKKNIILKPKLEIIKPNLKIRDISTSPITCSDKKLIIIDFLSKKFVSFLNNKMDKYGYYPIEYIINNPYLIKHNINILEFINIIKEAKLDYIIISSNNKYIKSTHENTINNINNQNKWLINILKKQKINTFIRIKIIHELSQIMINYDYERFVELLKNTPGIIFNNSNDMFKLI
jgi:hypothetical protein